MATDATARPSFRNPVTGRVIDERIDRPAVDVLTETAKATDTRSRPGRSAAR